MNETKNGWISKNKVKSANSFAPAKIKVDNFKEQENKYILKLHLDKKVPFEINEGETLTLQFYKP